MISDNYIPEKINEYNVYLDGVKMIGVASSHTLPEVNMQTSTCLLYTSPSPRDP